MGNRNAPERPEERGRMAALSKSVDSLWAAKVSQRNRAELESMAEYRSHSHAEQIFTVDAQAALGLASSSLSKKLRFPGPRSPKKNFFSSALADASNDRRDVPDAPTAFSFSLPLLPSHS